MPRACVRAHWAWPVQALGSETSGRELTDFQVGPGSTPHLRDSNPARPGRPQQDAECATARARARVEIRIRPPGPASCPAPPPAAARLSGGRRLPPSDIPPRAQVCCSSCPPADGEEGWSPEIPGLRAASKSGTARPAHARPASCPAPRGGAHRTSPRAHRGAVTPADGEAEISGLRAAAPGSRARAADSAMRAVSGRGARGPTLVHMPGRWPGPQVFKTGRRCAARAD